MARKRRRPARKKAQAPVWLWLVAGVLLGLGIATAAIIGGYVPQPKQSAETETPKPGFGQSEDSDPIVADTPEPTKRHYDFFTVLPEMEVVVPETEIREQAQAGATSGPYILQVASFRTASDADALKARLALLGMVANIQEVTVNDATWHRVRLGPFDSAREVNRLQITLRDNNIDSRVYKDQ
jgi:cell division protein FtsN